jgi:protoporphyrinogen/coproporphyrinogen III oxidase
VSAEIVIIGGGISGLAAAYFLSKRGIRSTIVEKSDRLGGLIRTELIEGCQIEAGPDSYLAAKPSVTQLAEELGSLKAQIIGSNDGRRRIFVVRGGRLIPFPQGMVMMAPGRWLPALRSELFSSQTKLQFLAETRRPPRQREGDISVAELVEDHFGKEVLDYVAEPLLSGVYGGDSASLSAGCVLPRFVGYEQKYGSLIKGVRHERRQSSQHGSLFLSFRNGMQELPEALAGAIAGSATVVQAEAGRIERTSFGWRIETLQGSIDAGEVILACPAYAGARLIEVCAPALASELAAIPYSSAVLATLVYNRARFGNELDGFGFLVPRAERQTISAATWVSTKFPSRIPQDLVALRAFIVDPQATKLLNQPEATVVQLAQEDFRRLMHIESSPQFASVHFWPQSMPQYVVGHEQRRQRIFQMLAELPGLHLSGNAYDGVGISDCVRVAEQTANHVGLQSK